MVKILAVIGSCAGEKSNTAHLANLLAEEMLHQVFSGNASYEQITLDNVKIHFCRSCSMCFQQGRCPCDKLDAVGALKQKILDCDVLIVGSPVYLAHISGVCKAMLDRLAYWTHTFELMGKPCVVISTTSNNHGAQAVDYLEESFARMGAIVAAKLNVFVDKGSPHLHHETEITEVIDGCCHRLSAALSDSLPFITELQEESFLYFNHLFRKQIAFTEKYPMFTNYEIDTWKRRGLTEFDTFSEAVENVKQHSRHNTSEKE